MSAALRFDGVLPPRRWPDSPAPLNLVVPGGRMCVVRTTPSFAGPLARMSAGLVAPSEGRVAVLGADPARLGRLDLLRLRRRLGAGLQPGGLLSNITLRRNFIVPLLYSGRAGRAEAHRTANELMDAAGLSAWADRRPAEVPPDVRRAAVLVRAVANEPDLLLLEDPEASLPPQRATALIDLCRQRARSVFITISEPAARLAGLADIAVVWDGRGARAEQDHETRSGAR